MFDVQYFVNEEKRIVVAKISGAANELCCDLCKKGIEGVPVFTQDKFVGKAKCSPDDAFDIEKGKKIAFKRAYYKYVKAKHAEINRFADWVEQRDREVIETLHKMSVKFEQSMERRLKEIEGIIKE